MTIDGMMVEDIESIFSFPLARIFRNVHKTDGEVK